jgi:ribosomal protein S4
LRINLKRISHIRKKRTKVTIAALDAKKFRALYHNIPLKQLRCLLKNSFDTSFGSKYYQFIMALESRLDVLIFRLHFVDTIGQARQFINHEKITVNGTVINRQSYRVSVSDVVSSVFKFRNYFLANILRKMLPFIRSEILYYYPIYYEVNYRILSFKVVRVSKSFKDKWVPFFSKRGHRYLRNGYTFFSYRKRFF